MVQFYRYNGGLNNYVIEAIEAEVITIHTTQITLLNHTYLITQIKVDSSFKLHVQTSFR